jgi:hypothetical protein
MRRLAENRVVDAGTLQGMDLDDLADGSGSVFAATVATDGNSFTGDITDARFQEGVTSGHYHLTIGDEDLDGCSGVVTPGANADGANMGIFVYDHNLLWSAWLHDNQAQVSFSTQDGQPGQTAFHVVIVCP